MVFVLYGNILATHYRTVLICADELGLLDTPALELRKVDWKDVWSPSEDFDYEASPFKRIPWFEDTENGVKLYESRAIVKYMAMKTNSCLLPNFNDPVEFAKFESACSLELGDFSTIKKALLFELVQAPHVFHRPTNQVLVDSYKQTLSKTYQGYERILSKQDYLAGDKLTLVDLFHVPSAHWLWMIGGLPEFGDGTLPIPATDEKTDGTLPIPGSKTDGAQPTSDEKTDGTLPIPKRDAEADGTWPLPNLQTWWAKLLQRESVKKVNSRFLETLKNTKRPEQGEAK